MSAHRLTTHSPDETMALGRRIGQAISSGLCIALTGPLGAGKTHLVKGLAAGLDVPPDVMVNSPTFVLINEYPGRLHVYHIDAYRLGGADELEAIGFAEMLESGGVVIVEWADRATESLPVERLDIAIQHNGKLARGLQISGSGDAAKGVLYLIRTSS